MKPKDSFEETDAFFMKKLENTRAKKTPPGLMRNFSAGVEARLMEGQRKADRPQPVLRPSWVPVFAPALAVLCLVAVFVVKSPGIFKMAPSASSMVQLASVPAAADISDEIAMLKELGAWNEEDEKSAGITDDAAASETPEVS